MQPIVDSLWQGVVTSPYAYGTYKTAAMLGIRWTTAQRKAYDPKVSTVPWVMLPADIREKAEYYVPYHYSERT